MSAFELPEGHTPGPWQSLDADFIGTVEDDYQTIAYASCHRNRKMRDARETGANARLIALAPAMAAEIRRLERENAALLEALALLADDRTTVDQPQQPWRQVCDGETSAELAEPLEGEPPDLIGTERE